MALANLRVQLTGLMSCICRTMLATIGRTGEQWHTQPMRQFRRMNLDAGIRRMNLDAGIRRMNLDVGIRRMLIFPFHRLWKRSQRREIP